MRNSGYAAFDVYVFEKLSTGQGKDYLACNNGSTALSQFVDTLIFYSIAFYGVIPAEQLPLLVLGTYLVKICITMIDTPFVYLLVKWITGKWSSEGDLHENSLNEKQKKKLMNLQIIYQNQGYCSTLLAIYHRWPDRS